MLVCAMRIFTTALIVTLFAGPAQADPISDALFGRPFSEGVVTSGAFGYSGADYYRDEVASRPRALRIPANRVSGASRQRQAHPVHPAANFAPVVVHPYRP
ncbi:hypothetical protein GCM10007884_35420 [Methylobacterium brachythecii]|uniref:Secreted protein n=1 Tax=Methylobacterium brachythecii TaxID=1176177 RepID=A0ABQ6D749_9HYPH|nr:hypothetical protein GCM10007884_35420 [Methylobacterium brachythecii]